MVAIGKGASSRHVGLGCRPTGTTKPRSVVGSWLHSKFACGNRLHGLFMATISTTTRIQLLSRNRHRAAVVFCPRTHWHFGHARYPLDKLRDNGIPICLGTDSRASNPDLSILEEARFVRLLFPEIDATEIMQMITSVPGQCMMTKPVLDGWVVKHQEISLQ